MKVDFLLFEDFETLDAFGPAEIFGHQKDMELHYCSLSGGPVRSGQGLTVSSEPADLIAAGDVLLVPGGMGTRKLVHDAAFVKRLKTLAEACSWVLTVCTGSALLAQTGLLDGRRATTNKYAFDWVVSCRPQVFWQKKARWCMEDKYYTSSGVSAGMDMAFGFLADRFGRPTAEQGARAIEYLWHSDPQQDPFARP